MVYKSVDQKIVFYNNYQFIFFWKTKNKITQALRYMLPHPHGLYSHRP